MNRYRELTAFVVLLLVGLGVTNSKAGDVTFSFERDPSDRFHGVRSTQEEFVWSENGPWAGTGNPHGFLSITEATPNTSTIVVFEDIDKGRPVKSFRLAADIRAGNGTSDRPGYGFSIGFARARDPVLDGNFGLPGPPENGAQTGISVSFDTWQGHTLTDGSGDIEGIIVTVDGEAVSKTPLSTRHGWCEDTTSLQTGPQGAPGFDFPRGDPGTICWTQLEIELSEDGLLSVSWKGQKILEGFEANFSPSAGQVYIAGRTGEANQIVHVDNVRLVTHTAAPAVECFGPWPLIPEGILGEALRLEFPNVCYGNLDFSELRILLDGRLVTDLDVFESVHVRVISIPLEPRFASGSEHLLEIKFPGNQTYEWTVTVPEYKEVGGEHALDGPFIERGFDMRVLQSPIALDNETNVRERHLAGELLDANEAPLENLVDPFGARSNGDTWSVESVINFEQDGDWEGVFRSNGTGSFTDVPDNLIPGIPGVRGGNDNITAEILTVVEIPTPGLYNFAFNSDDGFRTTAGNVYDDEEAIVISEFSGGRGASTTFGVVLFEEPGFYELRTLWYEGGGGASLEWWGADLQGNPIALLNDDFNGGLKTYRPNRRSSDSLRVFHTADGKIQIEFSGTLLSSDTVDGDYLPVQNARSPYTVEIAQGERFFISR